MFSPTKIGVRDQVIQRKRADETVYLITPPAQFQIADHPRTGLLAIAGMFIGTEPQAHFLEQSTK